MAGRIISQAKHLIVSLLGGNEFMLHGSRKADVSDTGNSQNPRTVFESTTRRSNSK